MTIEELEALLALREQELEDLKKERDRLKGESSNASEALINAHGWIAENSEAVNTFYALGEVRSEVSESDKMGFDFVSYYVNDILVRQEYVPHEGALGTAENPIIWADGMTPIDNAYYLVDGVRKVYMDGEFIEF